MERVTEIGRPPRSTSREISLPTLSSSREPSGQNFVTSSPPARTSTSPTSSFVIGGPARHDLLHHQHSGAAGIAPPHLRFGLGPQSQPPDFVVGAVGEDGLQGAPRHGLPVADEVEGAHDGFEGQVEARRGDPPSPGVERDGVPVDVDHGRPRRPARCARRRLVVEGVEIVVAGGAVPGRFPIEARQGSRQDRQLLAGVVSHHADLRADPRVLRDELQLAGRHELDLGRVVADDPEVVDGIAIDDLDGHLFVIEEYGLDRRRPRVHDVTVGDDEAALGVDHESRGQLVGLESPCRRNGARSPARRRPRGPPDPGPPASAAWRRRPAPR